MSTIVGLVGVGLAALTGDTIFVSDLIKLKIEVSLQL